MFDLLENSEWTKRSTLGLKIAGQYLGREIYNLVACEGTKRVVRHETLSQCRPLITTSTGAAMSPCLGSQSMGEDRLSHLAESLNNARTMIYPLRRRDASSHMAVVVEKEHKRLLTQKSIIEKRKEEH
ncbi:hypothetical protein MTR67_045373 [Solanum verrucosum]|uniref:Uncharacterized protein n=1 Tax=Solanum verrucosum TaxID=315347 RepID=A0AAF0UVA4_SOLVR|nr:hypothetical protein MTR67_045373 [Solanum verrucosum]